MMILVLVVLVAVAVLVASSVRILKECERGVVFRLGRCVGIRGAGDSKSTMSR